MNHASELTLHMLLSKLGDGSAKVSEDTIEQIVSDVREALFKQFRGESRNAFRVRMSNIGRPYCQLWYAKNKPDVAEGRSYNFILNMMMGDIVEAVFKGLLTEAGVNYEGSENVTLKLSDGTQINGTTDLSINGAVDDIKSASPYSYTHKFDSIQSVTDSDPFGYVGQLVGYAKAANKKVGGWWVINKANGQFKYVTANTLDVDKTLAEIEAKLKRLEANEFERDFEPVNETFRSKATGNKILGVNCRFCDFKRDCWPELQTLPSIPSSARNPPDVDYTHVAV
jgi:hypothetical protein